MTYEKSDFLHRTVTLKRELPSESATIFDARRNLSIEATRTRTSSGHASINIRITEGGNIVPALGATLSVSSELFGSSYEQAAFIIAEVLNDIASNRCELPPIDGGK